MRSADDYKQFLASIENSGVQKAEDLKAQGVTYYEVFNIARDAQEEDIKKAYKRLALQYHPDKNQSEHALSMFKIISEIHTMLLDSVKRFDYNKTLPTESNADSKTQSATQQPSAAPAAATAPAPAAEKSYTEAAAQQSEQPSRDDTAHQSSGALIESKEDFATVLEIVANSLLHSSKTKDPNTIAEPETAVYYLSQLKLCCKSGIEGKQFSITEEESKLLNRLNVLDFSATRIMGKYINSAETYRWTLNLMAYEKMTSNERKMLDRSVQNTFNRYLPYIDSYRNELREVGFTKKIVVTPAQLNVLFDNGIESLSHLKVKGDLAALPVKTLEHFLMHGGKINYENSVMSPTQLVQLRQSSFITIEAKNELQAAKKLHRNPHDADTITDLFSSKKIPSAKRGSSCGTAASPDNDYVTQEAPSPSAAAPGRRR